MSQVKVECYKCHRVRYESRLTQVRSQYGENLPLWKCSSPVACKAARVDRGAIAMGTR